MKPASKTRYVVMNNPHDNRLYFVEEESQDFVQVRTVHGDHTATLHNTLEGNPILNKRVNYREANEREIKFHAKMSI